jgi:DHA1 family multidrug resistance protein-like MFS transporter
VWLSQFFSLMGFGFAMPFAAFYIHDDLGIVDEAAVKYWTAVFMAASPVTLAIMAPLWGRLADLYGRRMMMLRATFGGFMVLLLMGFVPNVEWLIFLRLLQGMFTGTVTAALTLVAVSTPAHRQGLAIGSLSAAVNCGQIAGYSLGGYCSKLFSFADCFKLSSLLLLVSGLLVLLAVKENFVRPEQAATDRRWLKLPPIGPGWPLLVLVAAVAFVSCFDRTLLPLFVKELLNTGTKEASYWTGQLMAAGGVASVVSGVVMGWLVDRFRPQLMGKLSAVGSGLFMLGQGLALNLWQLFATRSLHLFFLGGLDPALQIWLVRETPEEKRGSVLGWAVTARSLGWIFAPLLSAGVADFGGLRLIFFIAAGLFVLLLPLIGWTTRRMIVTGKV